MLSRSLTSWFSTVTTHATFAANGETEELPSFLG